MPAVVAHGAGDLRLEEFPVPAPGPGEVAVSVRYGGICGSDLHYWRHGAVGDFRVREPLVLGHEVSGVVRAAGPGVREVEPGVEVAVHPATPCGLCAQCRADRRNICAHTAYLGSAAHFPHVQGGFAGVLVVPETQVLPLPAGVGLRRAALAEPASVAWHAVRRAGDLTGKRVLVTGAGPIGCLVVAAARAAGAAEVVVTDVYEAPLAVAGQVGATTTIRLGTPEHETVGDLNADVAIESSGTGAGFGTCLDAVTRGGRVVGLGLLPPGGTPVVLNTIITKELDVVGSFRFDHEMTGVLNALEGTDPVITATLPVERFGEAFELAANPARSCKVLLDFGTGN
ncbi:zinc-binding alcohol dehydrogenase [Lentzea aerocolonigenes]|uniref:Zinc-binding alcohol dehydrogenase n=1 Tax=Lentzea aerocolonigenes TaxID=68170 RepID=A0A0F0GGH6_LENAE|nr:L-idonate 5-dehydrogenase [Lentzea aerocolonigenes]KJK42634.1 zinc-binding alcohol dehydrogenase [Lentzea aerocolonigenes]